MCRKGLVILGVLCALLSRVQAETGQYLSYGGGVNAYFIDMDLKRAGTNSPSGIHWGLNGSYGFSIKEYLNVRTGIDLFYFKPKNVRGYYEFCEHDDIDVSCLPIVTTYQIHAPIDLEFYLNSDYRAYRTFFVFGVMPVFSIVEEVDMIVFDKYLQEMDRLEIKNNGLKLQNFYLSAAFGTEFMLLGNWKYFIEPTVRFSPLMKSEDYSNALSYFALKTGLRLRIETKPK